MFSLKKIVATLTMAFSLLAFSSTATNVAAISPIRLENLGKVLVNPTPYLIFYGNFTAKNTSANKFTSLLKDYSQSTRWNNLVNKYYGQDPVDGSQYKIGSLNISNLDSNWTTISYQEGGNLGKNSPIGTDPISESLGIDKIVNLAITSHFQSFDPTGVYLVITDPSVKMFSWSNNQVLSCGWNSYNNSPDISSNQYIYGWVGEANSGLAKDICQYHPITTSGEAINFPNGQSTLIGSTQNTLIHELEESITDPWQSGWEVAPKQASNTQGATQIADLCNWDFGAVKQKHSTPKTIVQYNQIWNGVPYLIQQEYKLQTVDNRFIGSCSNN